jgi:ATP-binding cassette subfamily B protein
MIRHHFGRQITFSEKNFWEALEVAHLDTHIRSLPSGLDTQIGDKGSRFSGGQKQRLGIARAVLTKPKLLILDEATSALDSATETKLLQALDAVTKDRSTLVIAHRLATIRKADKILVMDHGTIVEAGSFDELYAQGGRFTQLVKEQFTDASGNFIS